MLLLILLTVIMWLVLKYTKFGRRVYAVGGNENAAYLAGINVKNFKLLLYGINGLFVAIATLALLSRTGVGGPLMGSGKEIDVIAAVVVGGTALSGGKGNLWGTFIGVLLLGCISNALNILGVSPYWQYHHARRLDHCRRSAELFEQPKIVLCHGRRQERTGC